MATPMKSNRHHVYSRRTLLRGLGAGAVLLAPFIKHRSSVAQTASNGNLLIWFSPNGHIKDEFEATGAGATFTLKKSLAPLEAFKQDIVVLRGLTNKVPTQNNSHDDIVRILTGMDGPNMAKAYGPSIDHVIGNAIGKRPIYVNPEPNRSEGHWRNALSWRESEVQEPFFTDPTQVFNNLFGAGVGMPSMPGMPDAAAERARARNKSILDFVNDDIQSFRGRINGEDKAHLDLYLDSLRDVEQRVTMSVVAGGGGGLCDPAAVQGRIAALPVTPEQNDDKSPNGLADSLKANGDLMVDLLVAGFACGTQRVGSILWQGASEGLDPFNNTGSPNHHSVSHSTDFVSWKAIDVWYAERFAQTLTSLKAANMLDKTMVVWVTEISQGHETGDFVYIVAGGQSLGIQTGQRIEYKFQGNPGDKGVLKDPKNRNLADLWVTAAQAMGMTIQTFGEPMYPSQPLAELRKAV